MMVGYKLVKPSLFKSMFKTGWTNFIPFVIIILAIVFTDLLMGIGMAVAIFFVLYENYKKPFFFEQGQTFGESGNITIKLSEDVTFLNKANIQRALQIIPENSKVTIDASNSINIHHDVVEIIEEFKVNAVNRNIEVIIIDRQQNHVDNSPMAILENSVKEFNLEPVLAN